MCRAHCNGTKLALEPPAQGRDTCAMTAQSLLRVFLVLWCVAFVASFVDFRLTEATGDGFTRGSNRVMKFLVWQGVAGVFGIVTWIIGARFAPRSAPRVAARVPGITLIAMVIAFALFLMTAGFVGFLGSSPPPSPDAPKTEPVQ